MAKNKHGTRSDLIHCDNCGEDYSSTYKRCPFCGARPSAAPAAGGGRAGQDASRSRQQDREDDYVFDGQDVFDDVDRERGGSPFRASGGRHLSGGMLDIAPTTIIGFAVSGVIMIAAILIVILVVIPMIKGGRTPAASNDPNTCLSGAPGNQSLPTTPLPTSPSPSQPEEPTGDPTGDSTDSPSPSDSVSPSPTSSVPPATGGLTLTAFGRAVDDITISDQWPAPVQLKVNGASGTVTWKSSDTTVATVSANGLVTAVNKGQCYITATDSAGKSQNCRVISKITLSATAPSPSQSQSPAPSQSQSQSPEPSQSQSQSPAPTQSQTPAAGGLTFSAFGRTVDDISFSNAYPTPVTLKVNGATGTVTWSSSDTNVATVDANGKVSMVSKGRCTVTATDSSGKTGTCIVRVN